jgi:hypothetical protein
LGATDLNRRFALCACIILVLGLIPTASASTKTNRALALATSGCQRGGFDNYKYEDLAKIIISNGMQHRSNLELGDNFEITQITLDSIDHIEQSWLLAGEMDKRWIRLYESYETALEKGLAAYSRGELFGRALERALVKNGPQINSLCKAANLESNSMARRSKKSQKKWIIDNAGRYLPKIAVFIRD